MPKLNKKDMATREDLTARRQKAVERLTVLESEVATLRRHIQGLSDVLATLGEPAPEKTALPVAFTLNIVPPQKPQPTTPGQFTHMSIRDATRSVIAAHNRPMRVREILEILRAGGKQVGGKDPKGTLRAVLRSYDKDFSKLQDGTWVLFQPNGTEVAVRQ